MRMKILLICSLACLLALALNATTLQQAYNNASPGLGYDKLINLDPGVVYTGGINVFNKSVGIKGNGAIIDLQNTQISFNGTNKRLEVDGCVIINGAKAILLQGLTEGLITHCTFYNNQYAIGHYSLNDTIEVYNTIMANNTTYGFATYQNYPRILHYIDAFQNIQGNYMEWCSS